MMNLEKMFEENAPARYAELLKEERMAIDVIREARAEMHKLHDAGKAFGLDVAALAVVFVAQSSPPIDPPVGAPFIPPVGGGTGARTPPAR